MAKQTGANLPGASSGSRALRPRYGRLGMAYFRYWRARNVPFELKAPRDLLTEVPECIRPLLGFYRSPGRGQHQITFLTSKCKYRVISITTMRTTLEIDDDVLASAKALATARGGSIGKALSELARRGLAARTPLAARHGFPVFQIPLGSQTFGSDDVEAALQQDDLELANNFLDPVKERCRPISWTSMCCSPWHGRPTFIMAPPINGSPKLRAAAGPPVP